jgi:hypothetical protein
MGNSKKPERCTMILRIYKLLSQIYQELFRCGTTYYRPDMQQKFKFPLGTLTGGGVSIA